MPKGNIKCVHHKFRGLFFYVRSQNWSKKFLKSPFFANFYNFVFLKEGMFLENNYALKFVNNCKPFFKSAKAESENKSNHKITNTYTIKVYRLVFKITTFQNIYFYAIGDGQEFQLTQILFTARDNCTKT